MYISYREKYSIFFYCRPKGSENLRFSEDNGLMGIEICLRLLLKNINKFGR